MIKALLFDLDQTLLNRQQSLLNFIDWQFDHLALLPAQHKAIWTERFITLDQNGKIWKDVVYANLVQEFNIQNYTADFLLKGYIENFHKFSVAFANVNTALEQLHQQLYVLGLISNGRTPFQERNFRALNLQHLFSTVIVSEAVNLRKPDIKIFHLACQQLDIPAEQCIFMGDDLRADIQGARNAGMKTIHFQSQSTILNEDADQVIQDFSQLSAAIQQIQNQLI